MTRAALFLSELEGDLRESAASVEGLSGRLEALERAGTVAWPDLPLAEGHFCESLGARMASTPPKHSIERWLDHVQAADLHLALACAQGAQGAIEAFEKAYKSDLDRLVNRFKGPTLPPEDLLQTLREKLFVHTERRPARISDYNGQGYLQNWLRVTGARAFIDALRSDSRRKEAPAKDEDQLLNLPDPSIDTELAFLKREYRSLFKEVFGEAARSLSSHERNLLRQHLVAGLTVEQLGRLYDVHPSTASRRVTKARETLLKATRQGLMARLAINRAEFDSIMQLIRSRLDLSMPRLLQTVTRAAHEVP